MLSASQALLLPDNTPVADAGQYFTASLAPGAAALDYVVITSFSATSAFAVVQNADSASVGAPFSTGRNLHLKYLRFAISQAPASATSAVFASVIDTGSRTPTGGQNAITPVNCLSGANSSIATANVWSCTGGAAITVPAAVAASTIVGNLILRGQIPVVNDEYTIQFGGVDFPSGNLVTAAPNGASRITAGHPPIVLAPGHFALFYLWFPSNAATEAKFSGIDLGYTML